MLAGDFRHGNDAFQGLPAAFGPPSPQVIHQKAPLHLVLWKLSLYVVNMHEGSLNSVALHCFDLCRQMAFNSKNNGIYGTSCSGGFQSQHGAPLIFYQCLIRSNEVTAVQLIAKPPENTPRILTCLKRNDEMENLVISLYHDCR